MKRVKRIMTKRTKSRSSTITGIQPGNLVRVPGRGDALIGKVVALWPCGHIAVQWAIPQVRSVYLEAELGVVENSLNFAIKLLNGKTGTYYYRLREL